MACTKAMRRKMMCVVYAGMQLTKRSSEIKHIVGRKKRGKPRGDLCILRTTGLDVTDSLGMTVFLVKMTRIASH